MKNIVLALTVLIICACGGKKDKKTGADTGASLETRLEGFIKANDEMNLEQMAEYIYPKLYTIVPKASLIKTMKETFDNDDVKVELDSVKVDKVFPVFQSGDGSFAKVSYSMIMRMNFISKEDTASDNSEMLENIRQSLAAEYGAENVSLDEKGIISIKEKSTMVAIKDEHAKEWSFVELKTDDAMKKKLFSQDVLDKLATYN